MHALASRERAPACAEEGEEARLVEALEARLFDARLLRVRIAWLHRRLPYEEDLPGRGLERDARLARSREQKGRGKSSRRGER